MGNDDQNRISYFPDSIINEIALPDRFTFPFYYEPHPLAKIAAAELECYLETQTDLNHNFGLTTGKEEAAIGKMFGVLVVLDTAGKPGYLSGNVFIMVSPRSLGLQNAFRQNPVGNVVR